LCIGLTLSFYITAGLFCPVISAQDPVKPEIVLPDGYPDGFDGFGRIDRISEEEIVIDDVLYPLSSYAEYHIPYNLTSVRSMFNKGDMVGYEFDVNKAIRHLWLIKK
jgi:hypothetical protein